MTKIVSLMLYLFYHIHTQTPQNSRTLPQAWVSLTGVWGVTQLRVTDPQRPGRRGGEAVPQQAVGPVKRGGAPRVGPLTAEGETKVPNPCRKEHRAGLLQSWGPPADTGEPDCWPLRSSISCLLDSGRTRAMRLLERKQEIGNSPGGPVVRTLRLYCRGPRFNSRSGNQDPTCSVERPHTHTQKKEIWKIRNKFVCK